MGENESRGMLNILLFFYISKVSHYGGRIDLNLTSFSWDFALTWPDF